MSLTVVEFKRFSQNAAIPRRATSGSGGLDLYAAENVVVPPFGGRSVVSTDIGIKLPSNTCGVIMSRSGLCINNFVTVFSGLIDSDYTGVIKLVVLNYGTQEFEVKRNMPLAQLVINKIISPALVEVEDLGQTERGDKGFGSSGVYE